MGKTLVSGTLAGYFAQKGFKVMAIDADPSPNLALTLGIPVEEANKIVPISENAELLESKTRTDYPGVFKLHFTVDDIIEENGMKSPYGVNLLVMGTVKSAGSGCACGANAVVRELLRYMIVDRDEIVVVDMEAGVEHMGRGTASHVDIMLIVADSSRKSLEIAKKLSGFAHQAGIKTRFHCWKQGQRLGRKRIDYRFHRKEWAPVTCFDSIRRYGSESGQGRRAAPQVCRNFRERKGYSGNRRKTSPKQDITFLRVLEGLSQEEIKSVLESYRTVAVVGLSRDPAKASHHSSSVFAVCGLPYYSG